jgi:hypothetical protein
LRLRRAQPEIKHGSTWFSITRDLAQYVVQNEEKIRKGFRFTLSADECFLQTLVYHSPFLARVNQFEQKYVGNARFIDWTRRAGNSPYTFRLDDFEDLMSRGEGLCFARKFDEILDFPVVEKIFDRLSHTAFAPR